MTGPMITIRSHRHLYNCYLLLLSITVPNTGQAAYESDFDYNYPSFLGGNGKSNVDSADDYGSIVGGDKQRIGPFEFYEDLDDANDKVATCNE